MVVPNMADLLRSGRIAPKTDALIFGNETRRLSDLKSLAMVGVQGSGKTKTLAYLISSIMLSYEAEAYVIDPHKGHAEGLSTYINPLVNTGKLTVINPFDTPKLLTGLEQIIDARLSGNAPSTPPIIFVIDELNRLAKLDVFDRLIEFIERCTTETRKANLTFIGSAHKWTARHFHGRSDIRGCMNSMLIHQTKPSQADLLLEDSQHKKLVKQLHNPGDAILVTDLGEPAICKIPFCSQSDIRSVADQIAPGGHSLINVDVIKQPDNLQPILTPERCKNLRRSQSLSQKALSEQAGVDPNKIKRYELRKSELIGEDLSKVLAVLEPETDVKTAKIIQLRTVNRP